MVHNGGRSDVPRHLTYRGIANDLEARIRAGEFLPGWEIPRYQHLADAYEVSVSTAQRAVMLLRDRELVFGVPGRGVFVRDEIDAGPANGATDRTPSDEDSERP